MSSIEVVVTGVNTLTGQGIFESRRSIVFDQAKDRMRPRCRP
jgi:hypothetical protein